jgi:hypothetical protein
MTGVDSNSVIFNVLLDSVQLRGDRMMPCVLGTCMYSVIR